jgi:hypothetical protein
MMSIRADTRKASLIFLNEGVSKFPFSAIRLRRVAYEMGTKC